MTNSLCVVCKTNPKEFKLVDDVLVCCIDCEYELDKYQKVWYINIMENLTLNDKEYLARMLAIEFLNGFDYKESLDTLGFYIQEAWKNNSEQLNADIEWLVAVGEDGETVREFLKNLNIILDK